MAFMYNNDRGTGAEFRGNKTAGIRKRRELIMITAITSCYIYLISTMCQL